MKGITAHVMGVVLLAAGGAICLLAGMLERDLTVAEERIIAMDYEAPRATLQEALNKTYRRKDAPTDVLAFAQREGPGKAAQPSLLGDIVISVETARRQARRKGPAGLHAELRTLAAHGLCHLLGYDHRDDAEEAVMNARVASLLAEASRRGHIRAA